jgi:hypothetical protein
MVRRVVPSVAREVTDGNQGHLEVIGKVEDMANYLFEVTPRATRPRDAGRRRPDLCVIARER